MDVLLPPKLRRGDTVRVVAPSRSRALVLEHDHTAVINERFTAMGLTLTYGSHVDERDDLDSSSIASRVQDLHDAFVDPGVAAIMTVIGGFNSNELLPHLDWDIIASNPKILCGFSDITALQNAILAKTSLVTYSGPHWSSFGMRDQFDQTQRWFVDTLFDTATVELHSATMDRRSLVRGPGSPGPTHWRGLVASSGGTCGRHDHRREPLYSQPP